MQIASYSSDLFEKARQVYYVAVDIEEASVTPYAEALAQTSGVLDATGCVSFGNPPFERGCQLESVSYSDILEIDALASASALRQRLYILRFQHVVVSLLPIVCLIHCGTADLDFLRSSGQITSLCCFLTTASTRLAKHTAGSVCQTPCFVRTAQIMRHSECMQALPLQNSLSHLRENVIDRT